MTKYISISYSYNIQDAINFIKKSQQKIRKRLSYELGIELKSIKQIIGIVSVMEIDYENRKDEIGCWIGKKFWGQGLVQEAIKLILTFGFKNLKLKEFGQKLLT